MEEKEEMERKREKYYCPYTWVGIISGREKGAIHGNPFSFGVFVFKMYNDYTTLCSNNCVMKFCAKIERT